MAVISRSSTEMSTKMRQYKWIEKDIISPERTKVWKDVNKSKSETKVAVIYYLSRNGQLEHPHFMEVPLSSSQGLYLRDVVNRLGFLRGKGMTNMYSWSSRRIYKNGFVWQDLLEDDLIQPTKACEYVLKGSEILLNSISLRYPKSMRSFDEEAPEEKDCSIPELIGRRNQSWSSLDYSGCEYRVYKTDSNKKEGSKALALDAGTQTGEGEKVKKDQLDCGATELSREEISPPLSSRTSLESWESVSSEGGRSRRMVERSADVRDRTAGNEQAASGRMRASVVLRQLVSCGSVSVMESALLKSKRGRVGGESVSRVTKDSEN